MTREEAIETVEELSLYIEECNENDREAIVDDRDVQALRMLLQEVRK